MTLKTSLIITSDASGAKREVEALAKSVGDLGSKSTAATGPASQLAVAGDKVAASAAAEARALDEAQRHITATAAASRQLATVNGAMVASNTALVRSVGQQRAGMQQLGYQMQDVGIQLSMGTDLMRVMAMQGGQLAAAIDMMGVKGAGGRAAAFFAGPWGAVILTAGAVLAPFVQKLFEGGSAADSLADRLRNGVDAADSFGNAQSLLGKAIDLTTGKINSQNVALVQQIRLAAEANKVAAQKDQIEAGKALRAVGQRTLTENLGAALGGIGRSFASGMPGGGGGVGAALDARLSPLQRSLDAYQRVMSDERVSQARRDQALTGMLGFIDRGTTDGKVLGRDALELKELVIKLAVSVGDQDAAQASIDALDGKGLDPRLRREARATRTRTPSSPKAPSGTALNEFGSDAGARIRSIREQFDDTPAAVRQVNAAGRQLDDLMEDLERRKPPNFAELIEQARQAKVDVREGLTRPFEDYLASQEEALAVGALVAQGRMEEAAALRTVQQLQQRMGPLTTEQKDAVQSVNAELRAQERQMDRLHRQQQAYVGAVQDLQAIVTQTLYEGPQSLAALPERLFDSFRQLSADDIAQRLFGGVFEELEDMATGVTPVQRAADRMGDAVDRASASIIDLGAAADRAIATMNGEAPPIVVTARRPGASASLTPEALFSRAIGGIATKGMKALGIGGNDLQIRDLGARIGDVAGKSLGGAFKGQAASGFASMLGLKQSGTGAAIGGAVGSFIPGVGSIVGGLLGGTLGGLFGGQARPGGATVSNIGGDAGVSGSVGRDKAGIAAGNSLGGQVASTIDSIVSQLGGTLGQFSVQIGKYKDDLRVNVNGRALGGVKGSGATGFGDDQNAAVSFAVAQAIAQGAVAGVSDKVAKAIRSSSDIDKALGEALKVQELEITIGGIGGQIDKAFRDFEATAKERVRLATAYGFDLVAIERKNGEDRARLADQLAQQQVGSLKSLIDEMTSGSLFEGTAMERIEALNGSIAKAKADLEAGVEGAGDVLAGLLEQRLSASKEAYGTGGAYAADRAETLDVARAAVARANAQIAAAQGRGSDPALTATNQALASSNRALDENNDQNAEIIGELKRLTAAISGSTGRDVVPPRFDPLTLAAV